MKASEIYSIYLKYLKMKKFIFNNYRWMLFVLCLIAFSFVHGFFRGAAVVGFFWTGYVSWKFYLSKIV